MSRAFLRLIALLLIVTPLCPPASADAATGSTANGVLITGTSEHVWLISALPTSGRPCRVYYNNADDPQGLILTVRTMPVMPVGAAAFDDILYFALPLASANPDAPSLAMREMRVLTADPAGPHRFTEPGPLPPIPPGHDLLQLAADADGPAILVTSDAGPALLRLEAGRWIDPAPDAGWKREPSPGLVTVGGRVTVRTAADGATVHLWTDAADTPRTLPWRPGATLLEIARNLVIASHDGDGLILRLVWGDDTPIRARLEDAPLHAAVITQRDRVAAYWPPDSADTTLTTLRRQLADISGAASPVQELRVTGPMTSRELETLALVMGSLFLTIIVFVLKPEGADDAFDFPERASLADPSRRLLAFLIDVIPGAFIAGQVWTVPMGEVLDVIGLLQGQRDVLPLLTAAAITILHSALSEAFWGRTLGKAVMGCRVVARNGRPPGLWVCLARNAVKVLCPPLALFVLMPPGASRPGDFNTRVIILHHDDDDDRDDSRA